MLRKWHFYKAYSLRTKNIELIKKLETIESYVNDLDAENKVIMSMKYFDCFEMDEIILKVFMCERSVYSRIKKNINEMADKFTKINNDTEMSS